MCYVFVECVVVFGLNGMIVVCYVFVECVVVFGLNDGMTAVCYVFCEMRSRLRIVKLV